MNQLPKLIFFIVWNVFPSNIADNIASHITASISEKQQIFETSDVKKRLNAIIKIMENETSINGVEKRIRGRVKNQIEKTKREYN